MKNLLVVCLVLSLSMPGLANTQNSESFMPAEKSGEPSALERTFFSFSTSAGNYIIRHDGMGEFTSPAGLRRAFFLRMAGKSRLERVYFLEHQRDLFLFYEVRGQGYFLARLEQTKRKQRWFTPLGDIAEGHPQIDGEVITIGQTIEISKADGRVLR